MVRFRAIALFLLAGLPSLATVSEPSPVPEPSTALLVGGAGIVMVWYLRRKRSGK
jgi:hypothetical protein